MLFAQGVVPAITADAVVLAEYRFMPLATDRPGDNWRVAPRAPRADDLSAADARGSYEVRELFQVGL